MGVINTLWSQMAEKPVWLLVFVVLLFSLSGYRPDIDLYGQSAVEQKCQAYRGVIVFADSKGFTDKRHVKLCTAE